METDVQSYIQTMPQYREMLNAWQSIFDFQANLAEKLALDSTEGMVPNLRFKPAAAHEKWQRGHSLLTGESLPISPSLFREALVDLRPLLPSEELVQVALDRLLASSFMTPSGLEGVLEGLIADHEACIRQIAEVTSADPEVLAFLLQTVLSPFFQQQARPYWAWLETISWRRGRCPICGSEPWLARLACEDGRRILACSLCRTEWPFDRLRCPFCEGGNQRFDASPPLSPPLGGRKRGRPSVGGIEGGTRPQLRYFTVNGDEAHRVDCCDRCQRYLKTVNECLIGHRVNLLLEDFVTVHLDTLAREYGYQ
jgi:FdhE protein